MKFSPSYYCSQIIVLRHDIWMTFSSQVTEQSINFVRYCHSQGILFSYLSWNVNCVSVRTKLFPERCSLTEVRRALSSHTGGGTRPRGDQGTRYDVTSVCVHEFVNGHSPKKVDKILQHVADNPWWIGLIIGSRLHVLNKQEKNMIKRFGKWEVKGK